MSSQHAANGSKGRSVLGFVNPATEKEIPVYRLLLDAILPSPHRNS